MRHKKQILFVLLLTLILTMGCFFTSCSGADGTANTEVDAKLIVPIQTQ